VPHVAGLSDGSKHDGLETGSNQHAASHLPIWSSNTYRADNDKD